MAQAIMRAASGKGSVAGSIRLREHRNVDLRLAASTAILGRLEQVVAVARSWGKLRHMAGGRFWVGTLALGALSHWGCADARDSGPMAGGGAVGLDPPGLPGANALADDQLLEVWLTLPPAALSELEEHGNLEAYLPATAQLKSAGQPLIDLGEIGVRHKGSYSLHHCWDEFGGVRSYADECAKLSFKLKFDEYRSDARFDGLKRLNLHASSGDATRLHELVAYRTFRDFGVDAPRAIPARLYVNDVLSGLFIAVEDVDGRYAAAHFPDGPDGNLYKEIWPNAASADADFLAALETRQDVADVSDFRAFAEAVARSSAENFESELSSFVEIDALLRYIAVDRALRNWDGIMAFYSARSSHNFFWYRPDGPDARFQLIPWDLDNTLWPFDPYMRPEQWVTALPIPDFNSRPLHCQPRPIWELAGPERVTPPRCDRLLNLLAEQGWERLVEIGQELLAGPFAEARLRELADDYAQRIAPLVAEDPTLAAEDWQRALLEFHDVLAQAGPGFEAFLAQGLIAESVPVTPEPPSDEELNAPTPDVGLIVGSTTNFEFLEPPLTAEPNGTFVYGDSLAVVGASWNTDAPLSGRADLRFDFSFTRGPALYDEWAGIGIAGPESDMTRYSQLVVSVSANSARSVRVRIDSRAYAEEFGGVLSEFGIDREVGPTPQAIVIDFANLSYPSWAKEGWSAGQGFPGSDSDALAIVLQRFTGIAFGPTANVDSSGELSAATDTGQLRIDNIYFR
jgi:spore coat protein H